MKELDRALPIALLRTREASLRPFRKELEKINLTVQQWRVIRVLAGVDSLSASEISTQCVLLPPSVSRILKNLSDRELITAVKDSDARKRRVCLTQSGRAKFEGMAGQATEIYARLETSFGADKMELLLDLLTELRLVAEKA